MKYVIVAALAGGLVGALIVRHRIRPVIGAHWMLVMSVVGWVLFSLYWSVAATHAPTKTAESRESRRLHEILMNAGYVLLLLPIALPAMLPFVQSRFLPERPAWMALGLAVQTGAFALAVCARHTLGRNWSGPVEIKTDHQLIRSGPYRFLRHPIYTAVIAMVAGTAIVIGRVHALFAVAVIVLAYIRKIRMEEAKLSLAFGADYESYRRGTWGLVPGLF